MLLIFPHRLFIALVFTVLLGAIAAAQQETPDIDRIHPGDLFEIDVIGSTEFDWRGRLSPEGFVSGLRFTESPVFALCKDPREVASEVAKTYGRFLNEPDIVVTILDRSERLNAVIYGAVKTTQRFKLLRPVRLAEIIVLSGGFTSEASGEIRVLRQPRANCAQQSAVSEDAIKVGESILISVAIDDLLAGKPDADLQIVYGDLITVEESAPVFVMGGVENPVRISYREGLSLSRAVSSAGGLSKDADSSRVSIFRRGAEGGGLVKADLMAIENGSADDIALLPYDIIDVARKGGSDRRMAPLLGPADAKRPLPETLPMRIVD